jgi:hypothetical protein
MAALTTQTADRSGALGVWQDVTATTAGAADTFANTGREIILARDTNDGGTLNIVITGTADGNSPDPKEIAIPASGYIILGPFPQTWYSSTVQLYVGSNSDVEVAIIRG